MTDWRGRAYVKKFNQTRVPCSLSTMLKRFLGHFVNVNDELYFSEENQDNQEGSVEEQLSIMKAIFLGGKSTVIN